MDSNIIVDKFKDKFQSSAWKSFIAEFFERSEYEQWHDGITTWMLKELTEEERDAAEQILIYSLKQGGMWATEGLATINSKKAIPVLKDMLKDSIGALRMRIMDALEKIERSGEYVESLIEEFRTCTYWGDKLEAAMMLRHYPTEEVVDALYEGILQEDYLVRYHSAESLLKIHGLVPDISQHDEIFGCIVDDIKGVKNTKEEFKRAAELMRDLLKDETFDPYP